MILLKNKKLKHHTLLIVLIAYAIILKQINFICKIMLPAWKQGFDKTQELSCVYTLNSVLFSAEV